MEVISFLIKLPTSFTEVALSPTALSLYSYLGLMEITHDLLLFWLHVRLKKC